MIYNEEFFHGEKKKKLLSAFSGKISDIKKLYSGNIVLTLAKNKDDKQIVKKIIFKTREIMTYDLEKILEKGSFMAAFGIKNKNNTIFPVCFFKIKGNDNKTRVVELPENEEQYKLAIVESEKSQQIALDRWGTGGKSNDH
ncbi:MAG: hypothetical protein ACTSWN_00940 [Promethearchaeota archaeon]